MAKKILCNITTEMDWLDIRNEIKMSLSSYLNENKFENNTFIIFENKQENCENLQSHYFKTNVTLLEVVEPFCEDFVTIEKLDNECLIVTNYDSNHEMITQYYIYNLTDYGEQIYDIVFDIDSTPILKFFDTTFDKCLEKMVKDERCWGEF